MQHSLSQYVYTPSSMTGSNTHPAFPISNLDSWIRSRQWRNQQVNQSEDWLLIDLGSAKGVNFVELIDDISGDASVVDNVSLQGNSVNVWTDPPFSEELLTITSDDPYVDTRVRAYFTTTKTYRYWRIRWVAAGSTFPVPPGLSKIVIGAVDPAPVTACPNYDGFSIQPIDRGAKSESVGGQVYAEILPTANQITLSIDNAKRDAYDYWRNLWNKVRTHTPFVFTLGESEIQASDLTAISLVRYVRFSSPPSFDEKGYDLITGDFYWSISVELQDEL